MTQNTVSAMPRQTSACALSPATPRPLATLLGWAPHEWPRGPRGFAALLLTSALLVSYGPATATQDRPTDCSTAAPVEKKLTGSLPTVAPTTADDAATLQRLAATSTDPAEKAALLTRAAAETIRAAQIAGRR